MRPDVIVVTPPLQEPVTLAELQGQCRVVVADENGFLAHCGRAARFEAESYLNKALFTQTLRVYFDAWADVFWLPRAAPLQSVATLKYYAADGTLTTLDSSYYVVDVSTEPGRVVRAPNKVWPALQSDRLSAIEVTYVAGETSLANIADDVKNGILVRAGDLFDNRPGGTDIGRAAAENCWSARVFDRPSECA